MPRDRLRLDAVGVSQIGAAVACGIRVERFDPAAGAREPEAVALARDRGEVGRAHEQPPAAAGGARERERV